MQVTSLACNQTSFRGLLQRCWVEGTKQPTGGRKALHDSGLVMPELREGLGLD